MARDLKETDEPNTTGRTLHYFWREIVKYKWYAFGVFLVTPIVVFIRAILAPLLFADLIEKASQGLSAEQMIETALFEVVGYLVLYVFNKLVLEELRLYWCWKMELLAIYDLAELCFNTVSEQSMQFHSDRFSGSLVSQTNKFVFSFERLLDVLIWDLWPTLIYIFFVIVVLWPQAPWYVIGILIFISLYALVSGLSFKKIAHLNNEEAEAESKQTGQLADSITNIISVKSYAREAHERHRFQGFLTKYFSASMNTMRATIKRDLMFGGVQVGITVLMLMFLMFGREWLGISIAMLVLIVNYTQSIMGELWNINHIFKNMNRVFGDAHQMTLILDTVDDVVDAPDAVGITLKTADIKFDNISFKHRDAKEPIFQNFNLEVKPGERIGLVGVSGSGKTTLTKLLLRFADVDSGEITVSGQNIKNVTQNSLRENIAYVPQETSLFHRSIAENIAYARPDATREEIQHAAELANAHEFIKDLPDGELSFPVVSVSASRLPGQSSRMRQSSSLMKLLRRSIPSLKL